MLKPGIHHANHRKVCHHYGIMITLFHHYLYAAQCNIQLTTFVAKTGHFPTLMVAIRGLYDATSLFQTLITIVMTSNTHNTDSISLQSTGQRYTHSLIM